ncbi:MAG: hypothetical protein WC782_15760 [Methylococcaceae bacterium]|jgi:hypothetical protein
MEEQQKDNFWLYIGGFLGLVIVLVFAFKSMHKEAIPTAYSETAKEVDAQLQRAKTK